MVMAAHAVVDRTALQHNLKVVRAITPHSKIMAVVKANAYGHGLVRVAKAMAQADAFAVARADEGVTLRKAGVSQRIAVLQGFVSGEELRLLMHYQLEPVVHSLHQVECLEQIRLSEPVTIWLKLDSGMHRLGFDRETFSPVLARLRHCSSVRKPFALMTHLANADVLDDPVTEQQTGFFRIAMDGVQAERSIANSAGVLGWKNTQAEWVRPGLALYGISPFGASDSITSMDLRPAMALRTRLIAVKLLETGAAVGYGGDWVCRRPTRLGVAAIGYGDGYPRHAPSGTPVLINGHRAPLAGRVSMDMISVDVTDCPRAEVGDPVTLWGDGLPVEEVARFAQTIPYELLCGVTQRVRFVEI
ncbi:alanine racemase [Candidatus Methylospira mobilis]|uniref:alanine racemase n=1 Tax=Candidatus Methylospira mobilis TaxID=1808979 RepID=UPI0028E7CF4F|nr:alanine racemase [Candidatus Methylospira mobilis]WNV03452.1 alanine racemase [Candidatus Methylospira mobilis]